MDEWEDEEEEKVGDKENVGRKSGRGGSREMGERNGKKCKEEIEVVRQCERQVKEVDENDGEMIENVGI